MKTETAIPILQSSALAAPVGLIILALTALPASAQSGMSRLNQLLAAPTKAPESLVAVQTPSPVPAPEPIEQVPTPAPTVETPSAAMVETPSAPAAANGMEAPGNGKTVYKFRADNEDIRLALAEFARANDLNIVPDNDVTGTVTLDIRNLPLDEMMNALLGAADCCWREKNGLIRVSGTETRQFNVDYLSLIRTGTGNNTTTLGSGGSSGGGGGGGGGGSSGANIISTGNSTVNVSANNPIDFWAELTKQIGFLLTPAGKSSLAINPTAGIIQVTDRPSALERVASYLQEIITNVHRQVEIDVKLYDVTLNDQFQFGIDWVQLGKVYGGTLALGGSTLPVAAGGAQLLNSSVNGLNQFGGIGSSGSLTPGVNLSSLVFQNLNTEAAINALQQQGKVEVISTPRIRTLNNQTALIKVGEDVPFFSSTINYVSTSASGTTISATPVVTPEVNSVTIGTVLSLTPQISGDGWISLDISPVLTALKAVITFNSSSGASGTNSSSSTSSSGGGTTATAPDLDTKQASTVVRVRDGNSVILGGLIETQNAENKTKVPFLGDIPLLGQLFTGTFHYQQKDELVIFVTPHIVGADEPSVSSPQIGPGFPTNYLNQPMVK